MQGSTGAKLEQVGKEVIAAVMELLRNYSQVNMTLDGDELTIKGSSDGFDVIVIDDEVEATIFAGNWHGHFSVPTDAAYFVAWLLSPRSRVVRYFRRDKLSKSIVELQHPDGRWQVHGHVGFATLPFGQLRTETLSNHVLSGEEVPFK